jgi:hypothetical protein
MGSDQGAPIELIAPTAFGQTILDVVTQLVPCRRL